MIKSGFNGTWRPVHRQSAVDCTITEELCPHTLAICATSLVGGVGGAADLLEWGHNKGECLVGVGRGGDIHLHPDIHLLIRGLGVNPFHHRCHSYGKLFA